MNEFISPAPVGHPDGGARQLSLAAPDAGLVGSPLAGPAPNVNEAAILEALRGKREAIVLQLAALDEGRKELAFEAHVAGGEAEKRLAKLSKSRADLLVGLEMLDAAIGEAARRVEEARHGEEIAAAAERAGRALEIGAELLDKAQRIDAALGVVALETTAIDALIAELNFRCGCPGPNQRQFESLGTRALKSAVMGTRLQLEHLAPRERRTFEEMFSSYSDAIARWADPRLTKRLQNELDGNETSKA